MIPAFVIVVADGIAVDVAVAVAVTVIFVAVDVVTLNVPRFYPVNLSMDD